MSADFLGGKAADMAKANPAEAPAKANPGRQRIPMSVPQLKLQTPDIPGYKLRWMRGTQSRLNQALQAGYEFVGRGEVELNNASVAGDQTADGNTDLGDRVSISAGEEFSDGQGVRLFLMKIRQEFWDEDQKQVDDRHESIAAAIRGDGLRPNQQDNSNRYVPKGAGNATIFTPRRG